jgi:hypothetical protein
MKNFMKYAKQIINMLNVKNWIFMKYDNVQ